MTAQLINGRALAAALRSQVKQEIEQLTQTGHRPPGLAVILVGNDPASEIYVQRKREACHEVGMHSAYYPLSETVTEKELLKLIEKLNHEPQIDGILVQLPLPKHIDTQKVLELIHPQKDVDGFHPYNLGCLAQRHPHLRPCTPFGVIKMLDSIHETYKKRHAVIIGASLIVGRPMALELLNAGATVSICHRFTADISDFVKQADIVISAVGKPNLIKGAWIKPGATVIDVGINRLADGSLCGDVEFAAAKERAAWITPVPGGVGPMTAAVLLQNTLQAAKKTSQKE